MAEVAGLSLHVGNGLAILHDVVDILQSNGIMDGKGNFLDAKEEAYVKAAVDIEQILTHIYGLTVPPNVDKYIKALPGILSLVGLQRS